MTVAGITIADILNCTVWGFEVMGTPLNSMVWLANKLAEYGDGLKKATLYCREHLCLQFLARQMIALI